MTTEHKASGDHCRSMRPYTYECAQQSRKAFRQFALAIAGGTSTKIAACMRCSEDANESFGESERWDGDVASNNQAA